MQSNTDLLPSSRQKLSRGLFWGAVWWIVATLAVLLVLAAGALHAQGLPTMTFAWNVPTNQSWQPLTFRLYYGTSVTTATNQFLAVVNTPVQVGNQLFSTNTLPLSPGNYFFTMTASNLWYGVPVESFFSNWAASVPPPPVLNGLLLLPPR